MKPWREVAVPHKDVLEGTFQQSEFAADLTAVRDGKATKEYQDAAAFFQRTYITEGMRLLLIQVAQRLNGNGGEPVIQLQTAFGGGKTHTLLAVFHLAARSCTIKELIGIPELLKKAGIKEVPKSKIAVLDGNAHAPGQPWKHGKQAIRTLWGELAWQLGEEAAFSLVKESDATGTSPGKNVLKELLEKYSPCVLLIDELVAYIRQFQEGQTLSGGSFESNMSFVQALTDAVKLVPNAIILASLPESAPPDGNAGSAVGTQAGGIRGKVALHSLEEIFGRVQALWKPVATEEAFEIVRRRLFDAVRDVGARDEACKAFAALYVAEGAKLPNETQESRYHERLVQAYPIHPEVFDRLYEDWTTIDGFQRTRGVLKLMAKVIYRLWKDDNKDLMILPGSLPLYDSSSRNELTYYLPAGWDPVLEKDIDGERAETTELENKETRFGAINAARRVARTLFLGSAPSSITMKTGARGLDRARVLLGCIQPGQASAIYSDALNRLADRLHYLNSSGDKAQDATRFWFDTRANLRREMEDRKKRFDDKNEVRGKMGEVLKKISGGTTFFDGCHIFTPHADVPDDSALRLVFLPPEQFYTRDDTRTAFDAVLEYVRNNGTKPRYRSNRLVFLAPDHGSLARLRDCIRTALAWGSIVDDVKNERLNIDQIQKRQAEKELQIAEEVLPRVARECFKWLLCPVQNTATDPKPAIEVYPISTTGSSLSNELERICREHELVITVWSPIHLRTKLKELYWKPDKPFISAMAFWDDSMRYLYLPRFKSRGILEQALIKGAAGKDFFGTAYAHDKGSFDGFKLGDPNIQLDDTLLLIEPDAAKKYAASLITPPAAPVPLFVAHPQTPMGAIPESSTQQSLNGVPKAHTFIGTVGVNAATAKVRLTQIAEEVITILAGDAQAEVKVTVEISATYPHGVSDQIKRAVSENSTSLGFNNRTWE
ncbi:MAG: ATP-binding protein [Chitinispirillaceae bacterium]|nr:ATP-binding protein [Chitinispirillaceae bacterium]